MPAFRGLTGATPNLPEAEAAAGKAIGDDTVDLSQAGHSLRESLGAQAVLLTRGSRGMSLFCADGTSAHLPVFGTDEVADVTGAGDTVISVFSLAVLSGSVRIPGRLHDLVRGHETGRLTGDRDHRSGPARSGNPE